MPKVEIELDACDVALLVCDPEKYTVESIMATAMKLKLLGLMDESGTVTEEGKRVTEAALDAARCAISKGD